MKAWLQQHDLYCTNLVFSKYEDLIRWYKNYDWKAELEKEQANKGRDCCARPTLGFETEPYLVLQVYPTLNATFDVDYKFSVVDKKWGFLASRTNTFFSAEGIPEEQIDRVLTFHAQQDHKGLMSLFEEFGTNLREQFSGRL